MTKNEKILILVPASTARGGITNYYTSLNGKFNYNVDYFIRGARTWPVKKGKIVELSRVFADLFRFFFKVAFKKYKLVQTTTSFSRKALVRDGFFILVAKLFRLKVIVFYRGWDDAFFLDFKESRMFHRFRKVYFKADAMIDLAQKNIDSLKEIGYPGPLYLESTLVDSALTENISLDFLENKYRSIDELSLLFLARVETEKGIYELLESFEIVRKKCKNVKLTIAGDGSHLELLKEKYKEDKMVCIVGFVSGKEKNLIYRNSHVFVFPSWFEGMPSSVLEAMCCGLPIITRNVGGLPDFFINGKHGYITESKDPQVLANLIEKLIVDRDLLRTIALENFAFGNERFIAEKVVVRIEKIFEKTLALDPK